MKLCCWSGRRCWKSGCDVFDCSSGMVSVCPFHGHVNGRCMSRKVLDVGSSRSIFDIWVLSRKRFS